MTKWLDLPDSPVRIGIIAPAVAAAAMAVPAAAQEEAPVSPLVLALIDDIVAGDREAAIGRIDMVETLDFGPRLVTTPGEFVDRMLGCAMNEASSREFYGRLRMFTTKWTCADGDYEIMFAHQDGSPYVTVANFRDPARLAEEAADTRGAVRPPPAPPAPPRRNLTDEERAARDAAITAYRVQACNLLGQAVLDGDASGLEVISTQRSRYMFGFHDPFASTMVVEVDGNGFPAAQRMVDAALEALGTPKDYSCVTEDFGIMVRWEFSPQDRALFAMPTLTGESISLVSMRYATREKLIEAQQRNAELEAAQ